MWKCESFRPNVVDPSTQSPQYLHLTLSETLSHETIFVDPADSAFDHTVLAPFFLRRRTAIEFASGW